MITKDAWDPAQYERFKRERAQPFHDLLALVERRPGMRALDLGCGTGEPTAELHRALACAATLGIDNSREMLAAAPRDIENLDFAEAAIEDVDETWGEKWGDKWGEKSGRGGRWDLVFSNAALHWVADHPSLLARLTRLLADRGQIAVQMPANHDHPSHVTAYALADEEPFAGALGGWRREVPVLAPERYAALLNALGYDRIHVRLQVYPHRLSSREDVVEWVKGTTLTDYKRRLPASLYEEFLRRYRARLMPLLEDRQPYLFTFKRILFWAALGERSAGTP